MKSMDRGIAGVATLITYMFLFLVPSFLECLAVVLLFFLQYNQWGLGLSVFVGVALYTVATIGGLTLTHPSYAYYLSPFPTLPGLT